jgi:hypothetical protein
MKHFLLTNLLFLYTEIYSFKIMEIKYYNNEQDNMVSIVFGL